MAPVKPTAVLMEVPGAVVMPWRNKVAAILSLFYGGEQTGSAWAAVVFGDVAPSGKLPVTFPATAKDTITPEMDLRVHYTEDLATGYRSRNASRAAYPFGHGLSYTTFHLNYPEVTEHPSCHGAAACLKLPVHNIGSYAGSEVAQAYVSFTQDADEPELVLRGFYKTRTLQPGEVEDAIFALRNRDVSTWVTGKGWMRWAFVRLHFGVSSKDIRHVVELFWRDPHTLTTLSYIDTQPAPKPVMVPGERAANKTEQVHNTSSQRQPFLWTRVLTVFLSTFMISWQ